MSKNFSIKSIAAVSGVSAATIGKRAARLGIYTNHKGFTKEQAHSLIYYHNARSTRTETLQQETVRLLATLQEMNISKGKQTVIAV